MKKICKVMALVTLVFVLTGCMKIRANIVIEDEKTASMVMDILYPKEMMDSYGMSSDDLKEQFSNGEYGQSDVKDISEEVGGEKYQGISVTAPKKEVKKILDELSTKDVNGKKEYTLSLTKSALGDTMDPSSLGGAEYSLKQMKDAGLEMTMTIQMPGKITDATIGKVKGNTVTIDLLEAENTSDSIATITSSVGGSSNAIYLYAAIGVGGLAIIAVAYVVISKKKKATNNSDVITIEEPVEITSESEVPSIAPMESTEETVVNDTPVDATEEIVITDSLEESISEEPMDASKDTKDETDN